MAFRFNFGGGEESVNGVSNNADISSTSGSVELLEAIEIFESDVPHRSLTETEAVSVDSDLQFLKMKTDQINTGTGVCAPSYVNPTLSNTAV